MKDIIYSRYDAWRVRSDNGLTVTDFQHRQNALDAFPDAVFVDKPYDPLIILGWNLRSFHHTIDILDVFKTHFQDRLGVESVSLISEVIVDANVGAAWKLSSIIVPSAKIWCDDNETIYDVYYWYGDHRKNYRYPKKGLTWTGSTVILNSAIEAYAESMTAAEQYAMQVDFDKNVGKT